MAWAPYGTVIISVRETRFMKTSRLLLYGVAGIITGLLIENKALLFRQEARDTKDKMKKKLGKVMHKKR